MSEPDFIFIERQESRRLLEFRNRRRLGTHGDDHIVRLVLPKRGQVSKHAGCAQVSSAGGADAKRRRCCCGRSGGESVEEHDGSASAFQSNCLVTISCVCLPTCKVQVASC